MTVKHLSITAVRTVFDPEEPLNPEMMQRTALVVRTISNFYHLIRAGRYNLLEDEQGYHALGYVALPNLCGIEVEVAAISYLLDRLARNHIGIKDVFVNKTYGPDAK